MPLFTITQKLKYMSPSQQKVSILAVLGNCWKKKSDFQRTQFKGDQADCAANRLWHFAKHISMAYSTPLPKVGSIFLYLTWPHLARLTADAVLHSATPRVGKNRSRTQQQQTHVGVTLSNTIKQASTGFSVGWLWIMCGIITCERDNRQLIIFATKPRHSGFI